MAIIAELFLVLAGFATGVSGESELHPAEKEVFDRAAAFGEFVAATGKLASEHLDHALCRVIKKEIVLKYLEELSSLEQATISQISKLDGSLRDSLYYSTRIMALTVDAWSAKFEFAGQVLSRIEETQSIQFKWISKFVLENAGEPLLQELGSTVLNEMDRGWVNALCVSIAEGTDFPAEYFDHPQAPDADLVQSMVIAMQELTRAADRYPYLMEALIDLVEESEALLVHDIAIPLQKIQCTHVINAVSAKVNCVATQQLLQPHMLSAMIEVVRAVILLGSPSFTTAYCDAGGDIYAALRQYIDVDKEFSGVASELATEVLVPAHPGSSNTPRIEIKGPLEFAFSAEQCIVYESLFDWLSRMVIANSSIGIGAGAMPHAYKLLFDTLWGYYQGCAEETIASLRLSVASGVGLSVRTEQDKILKELVAKLLLDTRNFRNLLNAAMQGPFEDPRALQDLIEELEELKDKHDMDLRPFHKFLSDLAQRT